MNHQCNERAIQTIDLGPEQLQIIQQPGQPVRVLFRGVWLREDASPWREKALTSD